MKPVLPGEKWNDLLLSFRNPHFLQTSQWANVKLKVGWKSECKQWQDGNGNVVAVANILQRSLKIRGIRLPFSILYIPRGPILDWKNEHLRDQVFYDLAMYAKENDAIFIKIDPDVQIASGMPGTDEDTADASSISLLQVLKKNGWIFSRDQIQFRNTVHIDLTTDDASILNRMKQKTRYNIRLAERKGVVIRAGTPDDFETLYRMYTETADRDDFVIRPKEYYFYVWQTFFNAGYLTPLIATVDGEDIAGLILFHLGTTAWYVYGMSREVHRNLMPTYLLQWQAILTAKQLGCVVYDLWGAPDMFNESDPMWGVYRFKQGLGGQTIRTLGAWDLPMKPLIYKLYLQVLPKVLDILRKKGRQQNHHQLT